MHSISLNEKPSEGRPVVMNFQRLFVLTQDPSQDGEISLSSSGWAGGWVGGRGIFFSDPPFS